MAPFVDDGKLRFRDFGYPEIRARTVRNVTVFPGYLVGEIKDEGEWRQFRMERSDVVSLYQKVI